MVVELLDYDMRFGQGFLFSPPRPVRAEALQGVADKQDTAARTPGRTDPGAGNRRLGSLACVLNCPYLSPFVRTFRRRSRPATTRSSATSGASSTTASLATPEACDALMRFRAKGGTVMLITNAPRPGAVVTPVPRQAQRAARGL